MEEFKKGDIVVCIDSFCVSLTINKEYEVIRDYDDYICVINDCNEEGTYFKSRFKKVQKKITKREALVKLLNGEIKSFKDNSIKYCINNGFLTHELIVDENSKTNIIELDEEVEVIIEEWKPITLSFENITNLLILGNRLKCEQNENVSYYTKDSEHIPMDKLLNGLWYKEV